MNVPRPQRPDEIDQPIFWEPSLAFLKFNVVFMAVGCVGFLTALFIFAPHPTKRAAAVCVLLAITAFAGGLLVLGKRQAVVWTLSLGVWTYITISVVFFGGVGGTPIIIYPTIILLMGWLVGARAALVVAIGSSAVTLALAVAESYGWLPTPPVTPPALRWVIDCCVFVVTAVLIKQVVQSCLLYTSDAADE